MGGPWRGVIEGFYGPAWTWDERATVMAWCHECGMTHYVHAPKDDPLHRQRWREPSPDEEPEGFARLVDSHSLREFAAACPSGIPIAWTGPRVVCDEITAEDAQRRAEALGGRLPFVWDNYPVNDLLMRDQLFVGPLRGRGPGLLGVTEGWLANPMIQPHASLLPLASVAAFLRGDDPVRTWSDEAELCLQALETIEALTGTGDRTGRGPDPAAASATALRLLLRWKTIQRAEVTSFGARRSLSQDDETQWRLHGSALVERRNATDRLVEAVLALLDR